MTLCLLPYTLSLFVAQQGWLSCYYLKMNYNIIISTCSYCIVCIIHKDLLFILFFLIYNRIGLSPICVIRTYVCPNMDNWTAARCDSCPWSVSGTKIRWGTEGGGASTLLLTIFCLSALLCSISDGCIVYLFALPWPSSRYSLSFSFFFSFRRRLYVALKSGPFTSPSLKS